MKALGSGNVDNVYIHEVTGPACTDRDRNREPDFILEKYGNLHDG